MSYQLKTIGCDPEVFFMRESDYKSAIPFIKGTKENPLTISDSKLHYDNVTAEFSIPPVRTAGGFDAKVHEMLEHVKGIATDNWLRVSTKSYAVFKESELEDIQARIAGCEPDMNAYLGIQNPLACYENTNERAAGGHVHIGVDNLSKEEMEHLVKVLDLYVTMPLMRYENPERRRHYGKAGSYRPKEYGLEYRTPSNVWIFRRYTRVWMFDAVRTAVELFKTIEPDFMWSLVIDNHDIGEAERICEAHNVPKLHISNI